MDALELTFPSHCQWPESVLREARPSKGKLSDSFKAQRVNSITKRCKRCSTVTRNNKVSAVSPIRDENQ